MKWKVFLAAVALLLLGIFSAWKLAISPSFQLFGTIVDRVETSRRVVALTFDDGPTPEGADSILAILAESDVRATFFFIGSELAQNPQLGPRFVAAGHELGNHTYSHQRNVLKRPSFIRREVESTDSLIRLAGHTGEIFFRPPYGKKLVGLPWYLSRTGRTTVTWDVQPDSYPDVAAESDRIVAHVRERVRPGSIIILHVMYPSRRTSLEAVRGIVEALGNDGYKFVTISELLAAG